MPSPAHSVLTTLELLELVLLQLHPRTLLTSALRVNYQWHDTITSSAKIQEALFFKPAPVGSDPEVNPILQEVFPIFFDGIWHTYYSFNNLPMAACDEKTDAFLRREASWRHMLVRQPPVLGLGKWHHCESEGRYPTPDSFSVVNVKPKKPESPTERAKMSGGMRSVPAADFQPRITQIQYRTGGLTMGYIYDYVLVQANDPYTSFKFEVDWDMEKEFDDYVDESTLDDDDREFLDPANNYPRMFGQRLIGDPREPVPSSVYQLVGDVRTVLLLRHMRGPCDPFSDPAVELAMDFRGKFSYRFAEP